MIIFFYRQSEICGEEGGGVGDAKRKQSNSCPSESPSSPFVKSRIDRLFLNSLAPQQLMRE